MKSRPTFFIVALLTAMSLSYCKGPANLSYRNISGFYKPDRQLAGLSYALFNLNDSITNLYVRIPMEGLRYLPDSGAGKSRFRLNYQLFDGYEKGVLIDSASIEGVDSLKGKTIYIDSVPIHALAGNDYVLSIELLDLNAGINYGAFLSLYRKQAYNVHDFLLLDASGLPLMRNFLNKNEKVRIRSNRLSDSLQFKFFPEKYLPASPPFGFPDNMAEQVADSVFGIEFRDGVTSFIAMPREGRYLLYGGGSPVMVVHRFYDGFPDIGSIIQMRESLRYISTDAEYGEMSLLPPRAAIDEFWIKLTGHSERALAQIRRYYGRVEEANRFFSLSREGWKSDRGMIYIVYGPPNLVYRNAATEQWTYGEAGNPLSLRFLFNLESLPENQAEYFLIRSETYRTPWHMSVSNWRR